MNDNVYVELYLENYFFDIKKLYFINFHSIWIINVFGEVLFNFRKGSNSVYF